MAKTLAILMVRLIRDKRVYDKVCAEVRSADMTTLQTMDKSLRYTEMVGRRCYRVGTISYFSQPLRSRRADTYCYRLFWSA